MPNGAGYMPYEDVPRNLSEEEDEEFVFCDILVEVLEIYSVVEL